MDATAPSDSIQRTRMVLRSAVSAEEAIWTNFGAKVEIHEPKVPGFRLLIDDVRHSSLSVSDVYNRWGEVDHFKERARYINLKMLCSGSFALLTDFGRFPLATGASVACHSEFVAGYAAGEATRVKSILIAQPVFERILIDHMGPEYRPWWDAPLLFDMDQRAGALVQAAFAILEENFGDAPQSLYSSTSLRLTRDALIVAVGERINSRSGRPMIGEAQAGSRPLVDDALYIIHTQDRPHSIHDIAQALGVGVRTVQAGFRKHLGASPGYILRIGRLDGAHRDLQSGKCATAHDAARKWGFSNAGRFAAEYKDHIGEFPSETLRRHQGR